MRLMTSVVWLAVCCAAFVLASCGDDGGGGGDAGTDSGTDTDTDTDADGSLEVLVLSESVSDDPAPAEGALVTLDKPGGERVELTTGADGTVVFEGLDWALGTASATASMDGHGMATHVGLTEADSPLTIRILVQPVEMVELSGTVTNMADESNWMRIDTVVPASTEYLGVGAPYSVEVPKDLPFAISAVEYTWLGLDQGGDETNVNWFLQEMEPISEPTTYDITFSGGIDLAEVSGSFDKLLTEGTPLSGSDGMGGLFAAVSWGAWATRWNGVVANLPWNAAVGVQTHVDINADGTAYDFSLEYMQDPFIEHYITVYVIYTGTYDLMGTVVREDGPPTDGSHAIDFLDVPVLPAPAESGAVELNGGALAWGSSETDARPELLVVVGDYTWLIYGPVGATSLAPPVPPEGTPLTEPIINEQLPAILNIVRDAENSTPELWLGARANSDSFIIKF